MRSIRNAVTAFAISRLAEAPTVSCGNAIWALSNPPAGRGHSPFAHGADIIGHAVVVPIRRRALPMAKSGTRQMRSLFSR
jgi:hypothetical protein